MTPGITPLVARWRDRQPLLRVLEATGGLDVPVTITSADGSFNHTIPSFFDGRYRFVVPAGEFVRDVEHFPPMLPDNVFPGPLVEDTAQHAQAVGRVVPAEQAIHVRHALFERALEEAQLV